MLKSVDRILLRVSSLQTAVAYYRDVLGLELIRRDGRLASFRIGEGPTELVIHCDPDLPDQATYYLVESVREIYQRRSELRLKFQSPPAPSARGFRATARDPFGNVLLLLDRTADRDAKSVEDAKAPGALFSGLEVRVDPKRDELIKLYERVGRTADDLPYTPHFEAVYAAYAGLHADPRPTRGEVWRHLLNLRKGGKLPKLGPARSAAPEIPPEDRQRLRELLGKDIGRRDRLPYTAPFDHVVEQFNRGLPRKLSPHQVWRLVATLAK